MKNKILAAALIIIIVAIVLTNYKEDITPEQTGNNILRFTSDAELITAFEKARERNEPGMIEKTMGAVSDLVSPQFEMMESAASAMTGETRDFSETNIQVAGVDEADIIKTDGDYIYLIAQGNLIIAKAYPSNKAEIVSTTSLDDFSPNGLFIHKNKLLIFGSARHYYDGGIRESMEEIMPYYRDTSTVSVRTYDVSNKENPAPLRTVDFEGNYITSRKIDTEIYFVMNSYPDYRTTSNCKEIIPLYGEVYGTKTLKIEDMKPIAECTDIGYIEPIQAERFITIASISMTDMNKEVEREVIVGSGQNVYASLENLYIAQTSWPRYSMIGELKEDYVAKTVITKFKLDNGKVEFIGTGEVKGNILNQFSMDEYKNNFRIATTISGYSNNKDTSTNNMYILDEDLNVIGELEGIAPGESIYSVRFMGGRGYMVTFRHVDPLFVIDLSDPKNPEILGKLKIPGYSDYLHPYDETHLIGIGKEVDDSIDADKVHTEGAVYYTAIQGVKLAIFDVSDVKNPIEMYKEVIGDRGTESLATTDHKAFLFDKSKGLLVIPMTVAELKEGQSKDMQGEYVFQGAYVYDLSLEDGFDLRGRVTHYDDNEVFLKSGYYFEGDMSIDRSLYIENVLYTLSGERLQLNDLNSLERLKVLDF